MTSSADAAADQTHTMMQDLADHWGLSSSWARRHHPRVPRDGLPGRDDRDGRHLLRRVAVRQRDLLAHRIVHPGRRHREPRPDAIIGVLSIIVGLALLRDAVPVGRGLHLRPRHLLAGAGDHDVRRRVLGQGRPQLADRQRAARRHRRGDHPGLPDLVGGHAGVDRRDLAGHPGHHPGHRRPPAAVGEDGQPPSTSSPAEPGLTLPGLRAILSRGADPAPTTRRHRLRSVLASSLRRSSVVERAAVNRLVVGSSPTAGATFPRESPSSGTILGDSPRPRAMA